jgi:hypothetical protein
LLVSVPRRDAHVAKNPPECRYCVRFALNNGERLFEPKWLAPRHGFEPRFIEIAENTQVIDSTITHKPPKAQKSVRWYKIGTKLVAPSCACAF